MVEKQILQLHSIRRKQIQLDACFHAAPWAQHHQLESHRGPAISKRFSVTNHTSDFLNNGQNRDFELNRFRTPSNGKLEVLRTSVVFVLANRRGQCFQGEQGQPPHRSMRSKVAAHEKVIAVLRTAAGHHGNHTTEASLTETSSNRHEL